MGFFNNQILNVSWSRFKNNLMDICNDNNNDNGDGDNNIVQIKKLHNEYIQHLLESCFLKSEQSDLRKRIHKMLELMIEFKNNTQKLLILLDVKDSGNNYNRNIDNIIRNIVHCMDSFESVSKFVFKVLD